MNILQNIDDYLSSDNELTSLLDQEVSNKAVRIKIFRANTFKTKDNVQSDGISIQYPYIVIESTPYDMDVVTRQYRLRFTIVSDNFVEIENIANRLQELLHFRNRKALKLKDFTILNSQLLTGGSFIVHENSDLYEQTLYFMLTVKG
jgi:hypothetical protein